MHAQLATNTGTRLWPSILCNRTSTIPPLVEITRCPFPSYHLSVPVDLRIIDNSNVLNRNQPSTGCAAAITNLLQAASAPVLFTTMFDPWAGAMQYLAPLREDWALAISDFDPLLDEFFKHYTLILPSSHAITATPSSVSPSSPLWAVRGGSSAKCNNSESWWVRCTTQSLS
ncbi:hypothetical protein BC827DRAFT_1227561 [Russula dissimulans]|nr:hypothetical protein BC827DRAFT_1227561 [Russula dissimulans]